MKVRYTLGDICEWSKKSNNPFSMVDITTETDSGNVIQRQRIELPHSEALDLVDVMSRIA